MVQHSCRRADFWASLRGPKEHLAKCAAALDFDPLVVCGSFRTTGKPTCRPCRAAFDNVGMADALEDWAADELEQLNSKERQEWDAWQPGDGDDGKRPRKKRCKKAKKAPDDAAAVPGDATQLACPSGANEGHGGPGGVSDSQKQAAKAAALPGDATQLACPSGANEGHGGRGGVSDSQKQAANVARDVAPVGVADDRRDRRDVLDRDRRRDRDRGDRRDADGDGRRAGAHDGRLRISVGSVVLEENKQSAAKERARPQFWSVAEFERRFDVKVDSGTVCHHKGEQGVWAFSVPANR